jgi:hypothetical protein
MPSELHEAGIQCIISPFVEATRDLDAGDDRLLNSWIFSSTKEYQYGDLAEEGVFIPDSSLDINDQPVLLVEVGFSQRWEDLLSKAKRELNSSESVLGVVVMNITERPQWRKPERRSEPDDFVGDQQKWAEIVRECQKEKPFGPITIRGHSWMHTIQVDICLLRKPRQAGDDDPPQVCSIYLITMLVSNSWSVHHTPTGTAKFPRSGCAVTTALERYCYECGWG